MAKKTLESYIRSLNSKSDTMQREYERTLNKAYTALIRDMNNTVSGVYAKIGDNDDMFASLKKYNRQDNVEAQLTLLINEFSKKKYKGMYNTLLDQILFAYQYYHTALVEITGKKHNLTPLKKEWLTSMIENEITGLTLKDTLQRDRQNIIYQIKGRLIQGINQGKGYGSMAKSITDVLKGDYEKAVRTSRTEVHRVKEEGTYQSALSGEKSGIKQMKTWNNANDERSRKNHRRIDGTTIPLDEYFNLGNGHKTLVPGESGYAEDDINCRCFLTYSIVDNT